MCDLLSNNNIVWILLTFKLQVQFPKILKQKGATYSAPAGKDSSPRAPGMNPPVATRNKITNRVIWARMAMNRSRQNRLDCQALPYKF